MGERNPIPVGSYAQDTADCVLVDLKAKGERDLLDDSRAAPAGIPPFHLNDGCDQFFARSLGSGSTVNFGREQYAVFSFSQEIMETQ